MFEFPFERGIYKETVYVKLDNGKMYRLDSDFSMTEVNWKEIITLERIQYNRKYPEKAVCIICVYRVEFDMKKVQLMDKQNPQRISNEKAKWFQQLGFISEKELNEYINH